MYDGPRSPCTQSFGLGLLQMPTASDMDRLETFFKDRKVPVHHEVCPLTDKALLPLLNQRGYRPIELSQVMYLPLSEVAGSVAARNEGLQVRAVSEKERDLWAVTAAEGWRDFTEIADLIRDLMRVSATREDGACFLVELNGQPIAGARLPSTTALLCSPGRVPCPSGAAEGRNGCCCKAASNTPGGPAVISRWFAPSLVAPPSATLSARASGSPTHALNGA